MVAYALAGTTDIDLINDPIGQDKDGNDVTSEILNMDGFVMAITSFDLNKANRKGLERLTEIANPTQVTPDQQSLIDDIAQRQKRIQEATYDLSVGKNK